VLTVLDDGPAGVYEQVTLDVATVTATNADPATAFSDDPQATADNFLLFEIDATTDLDAPNQFSADDFRLTDRSGSTITAQSVIDRSGGGASLQLRGRDSTEGIVVFATDSLVSELRGYTLSVDRDGRVPAVLPISEPVVTPWWGRRAKRWGDGRSIFPSLPARGDRSTVCSLGSLVLPG
jgi:hypothetical protein